MAGTWELRCQGSCRPDKGAPCALLLIETMWSVLNQEPRSWVHAGSRSDVTSLNTSLCDLRQVRVPRLRPEPLPGLTSAPRLRDTAGRTPAVLPVLLERRARRQSGTTRAHGAAERAPGLVSVTSSRWVTVWASPASPTLTDVALTFRRLREHSLWIFGFPDF